MTKSKRYTLNQYDSSSGQVTKTYVISPANAGHNDQASVRFDEVLVASNSDADTSRNAREHHKRTNLVSAHVQIYMDFTISYLKTLFLPTGYPYTVTPDYTPYQIFDSLQAFASSIAGLLSSRAVLQSLNVISQSSSTGEDVGRIAADSASAATAATLLSILQSTLSNLTSILFASHAAPRISSDVKYYRFLADVVNDTAFLLDLLAPTLPTSFGLSVSFITRMPLPLTLSPRVIALCSSSMLRAVCGVAGGSSKAVLSAHFARNNPESVGDLNAKDGSQETVIGLLGMWFGGVVVSRVESVTATWCWMIGLLTMHLWTNWCAVRSVRLRTLNRERATMVCKGLSESSHAKKHDVEWKTLNTESIGRRESVLGMRNILRSLLNIHNDSDIESFRWRNWQAGASLDDLLRSFRTSGNQTQKEFSWEEFALLLDTFREENYLLWYDSQRHKVIIALKRDAQPADQLKAWLHGLRIAKVVQGSKSKDFESRQQTIAVIINVLETITAGWDEHCRKLQLAGWDLTGTNLENGQGIRIDIE